MTTRRNLLRGLAAAPISTALSGQSVSAEAATGYNRPLDFIRPEDNLYGFMKLFADISGKRTFFYQPGRIFAHRDGELPLHLVNYSGITINEVRRINEGLYITRFIGWMLMRDPITNEIIDQWTDPWSGEVKEVRHFTTIKSGKRTHDKMGLQYPPELKGKYNWDNKPFIMPWQTLADDVWVANDIFSVYTDQEGNARYENAIHTYHGNFSDLENIQLTNAPSTIASQSQSPYFPWMGGLDLPGNMILTSLGKKLTKIDQIPENVLEGVEKRYPGKLDSVFPWKEHETVNLDRL